MHWSAHEVAWVQRPWSRTNDHRAAVGRCAEPCTDGSSAMAAAARAMGIEHHAVNMVTDTRIPRAWHIQNVNAYHSRLKGWIRRFRGVATNYLHHDLGWFRVVDRCAPVHLLPAHLLNLSLGRFTHP